MSVKIISKKHYRATCPRCECVYEFDFSDLERFTGGTSRSHRNGIAPYYGIKCPCCGKVEKIIKDVDEK